MDVSRLLVLVCWRLSALEESSWARRGWRGRGDIGGPRSWLEEAECGGGAVPTASGRRHIVGQDMKRSWVLVREWAGADRTRSPHLGVPLGRLVFEGTGSVWQIAICRYGQFELGDQQRRAWNRPLVSHGTMV
jgi:hypothetical protein